MLKNVFTRWKRNFTFLKSFTWQRKDDSSSNVTQKTLPRSRKEGKNRRRISSHQRTAAEYQHRILIREFLLHPTESIKYFSFLDIDCLKFLLLKHFLMELCITFSLLLLLLLLLWWKRWKLPYFKFIHVFFKITKKYTHI